MNLHGVSLHRIFITPLYLHTDTQIYTEVGFAFVDVITNNVHQANNIFKKSFYVYQMDRGRHTW